MRNKFILFFFTSFLNAQDAPCLLIKSNSIEAGEICNAYMQLMEFWEYKEFVDGYVKDIEEQKPPVKSLKN
jgi:hypothetical protein